MAIDPSLSNIAKSYHPKIEGVIVCELEGDFWGKAERRKDNGLYRIFIDPSKTICSQQRLFVLYHEIGHIILGHCDLERLMRYLPVKQVKEFEADIWAFHQMAMIDGQGKIKKEFKACFECHLNHSKWCLKNL